ncbi:hypothetical protein [Actinoplanes derwentensis]|uniref:Uncharacterized protein n=1 Tax=Actinoplanes derwentensis TaxID=113562 RepID=A0A1H2CJ58_9ACTN|nr:hypothetical protein [Actinoplanes derwentensis]GID82590.1 hypothetical protein Ade03nite_15140 [Actinoplanes derwentensis]SDT70513.1 hypothetical protein SAMN04489716_5969 [Actinoplanes derwentensis]
MSDFATAIERLLTQIHHWDERRWRTAPAGGGAGTRSESVQRLVQHLADLGAEAENSPARPVPHLHDLVLRDQIRVLADDILAAGPSAELLDRATAVTDEVRATL